MSFWCASWRLRPLGARSQGAQCNPAIFNERLCNAQLAAASLSLMANLWLPPVEAAVARAAAEATSVNLSWPCAAWHGNGRGARERVCRKGEVCQHQLMDMGMV